MHSICTEARAPLQTPIEDLAAEDRGIGGALESSKTVEGLWSWSFRQPIEIAIGSSHIAVCARRNIDDDPSLLHHCDIQRLVTEFAIYKVRRLGNFWGGGSGTETA